MQHDADILIIGGGLAGLIAGIHLSKSNLQVLLIEKQAYPYHKVCGEYISNEVLPYFDHLGIQVDELNPARIHQFLFSTPSGRTVESKLPLGGFGLSRYALDAYLCQRARLAGVTVVQDEVTDCTFADESFRVTTLQQKNYTAKFVIGAYGKRAGLDKKLGRTFPDTESPWLAVKAHYRTEFPAQLVSLHTFEGGYCGLSRVENDVVNMCYLAHYRAFKRYKQVDLFQENVLRKNPRLNTFFSDATLLYDKPLAISQISFARKLPVENHVFMCGDTAGLIHPLCGNGMAMAIHSAKLLSERIIRYYDGQLKSRADLENQYTLAWNAEFSNRLASGRLLQSILQQSAITAALMKGIQLIPGLLPFIIKQTHGKMILA